MCAVEAGRGWLAVSSVRVRGASRRSFAGRPAIYPRQFSLFGPERCPATTTTTTSTMLAGTLACCHVRREAAAARTWYSALASLAKEDSEPLALAPCNMGWSRFSYPGLRHCAPSKQPPRRRRFRLSTPLFFSLRFVMEVVLYPERSRCILQHHRRSLLALIDSPFLTDLQQHGERTSKAGHEALSVPTAEVTASTYTQPLDRFASSSERSGGKPPRCQDHTPRIVRGETHTSSTDIWSGDIAGAKIPARARGHA